MRASWKTLAHHCSRRGGLWLIQSTPIRSCVAVYHWPEYDGREEKSRSTNLAWEQVEKTLALHCSQRGGLWLIQSTPRRSCVAVVSWPEYDCTEEKSRSTNLAWEQVEKTLALHCSQRGGLWLIQSTPRRSCVAVVHWPEYDVYRRKSRLTNLVEENLLLMEKATESLKQWKQWKLRKLKTENNENNEN